MALRGLPALVVAFSGLAPLSAGCAGPTAAAPVESPDEPEFLSLLTVPPTHTPATAPVPVPEPEEPTTTSGTCVGKPSVAAHESEGRRSQAACCYTSPSVFRKAIHARWDAMQACYNDALTRNPSTQGTVVSKF